MPQREKGVALILALLVLTILIVIIGEMSFTSTQNRIIAKNYIDDLQNGYTARSGYNYGALFLQYDKDTYSDHLGELWAQPHTLQLDQAQSSANIIVEDEHSKINLVPLITAQTDGYKVTLAQLERLVVNSGYDKSYADVIADYSTKKGDSLYNVEEILRIPNFPYSLLYGVSMPQDQTNGVYLPTLPNASTTGIRKFLTNIAAKSDKWTININTAPREVLMALDDQMTPPIADSIISWRQKLASQEQPTGFKNPNELLNVQGVTSSMYEKIRNYIDVKSSYFTIKVRAVTGGLEKSWAYTVRRNGSNVELIQASKINDYLSIQPPQVQENNPQ